MTPPAARGSKTCGSDAIFTVPIATEEAWKGCPGNRGGGAGRRRRRSAHFGPPVLRLHDSRGEPHVLMPTSCCNRKCLCTCGRVWMDTVAIETR